MAKENCWFRATMMLSLGCRCPTWVHIEVSDPGFLEIKDPGTRLEGSKNLDLDSWRWQLIKKCIGLLKFLSIFNINTDSSPTKHTGSKFFLFSCINQTAPTTL